MTANAPVPFLLRLSMALAVLGSLVALTLFVHAGPYTLVTFMFVAQPLLLLAVTLFAVQVFKDLRRGKVL
jgi:cation transporter-like permease